MDASARDGDTHAAPRRGGGRTAAIATLAVAALALAGALAATLSHAEVRRTNTNDVSTSGVVATLVGGHRICQDDERAPAGTAAIRVAAQSTGAARASLAVELLDSATAAPVARGAALARVDDATRVRLRPRLGRERAIRVCVRLRGRAAGAAVALFGGAGEDAANATDGYRALGGRMRLDYLRASPQSWWALAPTLVRRIGFGHAWSGPSVALLAGLLTSASIALAAWLLLRVS